MGSTAPSPLYPLYLEMLGLSHLAGTAIFAIYALGTLASLLAAARLGPRIRDLRRLILPGLAATAAGALVFAQAGSVEMLLAGRLLSGLGTGAVTGMATAALYDLSPARRRGRAAALATLAFTGGAAGGPLLASAALALDVAPTAAPFLAIVAVAACAAAGLVIGAWPAAPRGDALDQAAAHEIEARDLADEAPVPSAHGAGPGAEARAAYRLACLAVAAAWMLGSALMALGADIASDLFGMGSAGMAGLMPALFQLFAGIGQAASGRARPRSALVAGLAGIVAAQAAMALAAPGGHAPALLLAMPAAGLAYGAAFVGALSLAGAAAPAERRARLIAGFYVVGYLGNALPTLAMGLAIDRVGLGPAFTAFSLVLSLLCLLGVAAALRFRAPVPSPA